MKVLTSMLSLAVVAIIVAACVSPPPEWELDFGTTAVQDSRAGESKVEPDAGKVPDVLPLDLPDDTVAQEILVDAAESCQPDCTDKECAESDGCEGYCYDEATCDDGIPCTVDMCIAASDGGCQNVEDHAACEDDEQCTINTCDVDLGCQVTNADYGCDDGDLCTVADFCADGICKGAPLDQSQCDDGNPCTEDACLPDSGCGHIPVEGACALGDVVQGQCAEGVCIPDSFAQVPCTGPLDCALLDNDNLCDGTFACDGDGQCGFDIESVVSCDASDDTVCLKSLCDSLTGNCAMVPVSQGLPCDDGDECTIGETCVDGECQAGDKVMTCNDHSPCTQDNCVTGQGCSFTALDVGCDDLDPCTSGDLCQEGLCQGILHICDDKLGCTEDYCDGEGGCLEPVPQEGWCVIESTCVEQGSANPDNACQECQSELSATAYSDKEFGDPCLVPKGTGKCIGGACKDIQCDPGYLSCQGTPDSGCETDIWHDSLNCGDCQIECGVSETCVEGECLSSCPGDGLPPCDGQCPDYDTDAENCGQCGEVCLSELPDQVGFCSDGECALEECPAGHRNIDGHPGNGCEYDCQGEEAQEVCDGYDNDCDGVLDEGTCEDGIDCTVDICNALLGCKHTPADLLCDDGNPCTADLCSSEDGCQHGPVEGQCDDGDPCTVADTCLQSQCVGTPIALEGCCNVDNDCQDENECTLDKCDLESHLCQHLAGPFQLALCDADGDGCTEDRCIAGTCSGGTKIDCGLPSGPCLTMQCQSTTATEHECVEIAQEPGTPCEDGLFCTVGETCNPGGGCTEGADRDCSSLVGACQVASCDEETDQCQATPVDDQTVCDADGDGCTVADSCQDGLCLPGAIADCSGDVPTCFAGVCVSKGADQYECDSAPAPAGTPCEDGLACTENDACDETGACVGGPMPPCDIQTPPCAEALCDEDQGGCILQPEPDGAACDDGDPCTYGDSCAVGQCLSGKDGCAERKLNAVSSMVFHGPRHEMQQVADLGFGTSVTVWRAGDGDVRAQLVDREGSKLNPELKLTNDDWPPNPANCGRAVTRPTIAARADGKWLVAVPYVWREMYYTGCGSAWYKRLCNFRSHYALGFSVWDRHGESVKDWTYLINDVLLEYTNTYYFGCNCNCSSSYGGAKLTDIDKLAWDWISVVPFSDGSFGILAVYTLVNGTTFIQYVPVTPSFEVGSWQGLNFASKPHICRISEDRVLMVYNDLDQIGWARMFDKNGAPLGEPFSVSDEQTGFQTYLTCRAREDGGFIVGYNSFAEGGTTDVYIQRFDSAGSPVGVAQKVNQATDDVQFMTQGGLVTLADGSFGVSWHDCSGGNETCLAKARLFSEDAAPATSEFALGAEDDLGYEEVLETSENGWLAVWLRVTTGKKSDVFLRLFDELGDPVPGAIERAAGWQSDKHEKDGAGAGLSGGRFAMAWEVETGAGDSDVGLQVFDSSETPEGVPVTANQDEGGLHYEPALVRSTDTGNLLVAWTSFGQEDEEDIYGRLYSDAGEVLGDEFRINNSAISGQYTPVVTGLSDGGFVVAWSGWGTLESGTDVFARVLDGAGNPVTGNITLPAELSGEQGNLALAPVVADDAAFIAAWSRAGAEAPAGVYVRKFDAAGDPLTGETLVSGGGNPEQLAIAASGTGNYLLCWRTAGTLVCRRLAQSATPLGETFVAESNGNPANPKLVFRESDRVWLLYNRSDGDAEGQAVFRRYLDLYGVEKGAVALVNWAEVGEQTNPFAAAAGLDDLVVGWTGESLDSGADQIQFRILD